MPPTAAPRHRWHHAGTWLDDLAIVSWAVDPAVLRAGLPRGFDPLSWPHRSGRRMGLVSLVAFRDRDFRFDFWPWTTLSCGQVNYRTYVSHRGRTGVWFYGTSLDSALVAVPRRLWRMPWHHDRIAVHGEWSGPRLRTWSLRAEGAWGSAEVDLVGDGSAAGVPPVAGLDLGSGISPLLDDPVRGWYPRGDGRIGRYSVAHDPLQMVTARVVRSRSAVFERLGLVAAGQSAVDARLVRQIRFAVHTPPRRGT